MDGMFWIMPGLLPAWKPHSDIVHYKKPRVSRLARGLVVKGSESATLTPVFIS